MSFDFLSRFNGFEEQQLLAEVNMSRAEFSLLEWHHVCSVMEIGNWATKATMRIIMDGREVGKGE